jgi:hypothetical protein
MAANNLRRAEQPQTVEMSRGQGICYLPDDEHAQRFIDWLIYDEDGIGHTVVMSDVSMFKKYLLWCQRYSVMPIPEKTLQTAVGRNKLQVKKDRPIKKCPVTGRALYLETGSPDRWTRYTIRAPQKLPGKVPVGDIVPARVLETKAQRAAAKAVPPATEQPDQHQQPLRRAA